MISYFVQGIVAITFGPVFGLVVLFFNLNRAESSYFAPPHWLWLYQIGTEIAWCAFQINFFLAVSIAISTMARFLQVVPVAEVIFLSSLAQYEHCVSVVGFCSAALFFKNFQGSLSIYIVMYSVMVVCAFHMMKLPGDTSAILADITQYCATVRDYPSPVLLSDTAMLVTYIEFAFAVAAAFQCMLRERKVKVLRAACGARYSRFCSAAAFICVQIGGKVKVLRDACSLLRACYSRFCSAIRVYSPLLHALAFCLSFLASTTLIFFDFLMLQSSRRKLQELSNGAYQEEQWGFGQVMAILAWVPFFQDFFVKGVFGKRLDLCPVVIFQRPYRVFVIQEWQNIFVDGDKSSSNNSNKPKIRTELHLKILQMRRSARKSLPRQPQQVKLRTIDLPASTRKHSLTALGIPNLSIPQRLPSFHIRRLCRGPRLWNSLYPKPFGHDLHGRGTKTGRICRLGSESPGQCFHVLCAKFVLLREGTGKISPRRAQIVYSMSSNA